MDLLQPLFLVLSSILVLSFTFQYFTNSNKSSKLPPGPKPFPIIGNILELGQKPHQSLTKLSKIYGPLIRLKLGSVTTIVVSSPETAKLVLQKHDQVFASRPTSQAVCALDHHRFAITAMPADENWRRLRRICKEQMLSNARLDASQGLRTEKLKQLYDYVNECSDNGQAVDIGKVAFTTSLNLVSTTLFSFDIAAFGSDTCQDLKDVIWGILEYIVKPNLADYFPILKVADPQGILRKITFYMEKCFKIFDEIIDERLKARGENGSGSSKNDMLEALLDIKLKNEVDLSFDEIKHVFLDLFTAGTDTNATTLEWVMAELVRNPDKMAKVKDELRNIVGQNKLIQESDISKLPYLQAIVKEVLRLHPVVPFLVPRKALANVEICGYQVSKDSQILVNVYAICRDPKIWTDPDEFIPERFLNQEIDFYGQHFEFIPFGAGRRICLGFPLAYRMVHLLVATLVQNFDWKLENGSDPKTIDMNEKFGLTLQKAIPLDVVPCKL